MHRTPPPPRHRPFALILAGGGARGAAHAGVLQALEHEGLRPSAIVGVSMGAIVGAAYALNPDWYRAYLAADLSRLPRIAAEPGSGAAARLRRLAAGGRHLRYLLTRWGPLSDATGTILELLRAVTLDRDLGEARLPFAAVATDLRSGRRIVLREGNAAEAVYASSALAGIMPPAARNGSLLADGAYADVAPIDVGRDLLDGVVIAVNPSGGDPEPELRNGLQVLRRSIEIAYQRHAAARFREADFELRVAFPHPIASTDFAHTRTSVAAGIRAVRRRRAELRALLAPLPAPSRHAAAAVPHSERRTRPRTTAS